MTSRLALFLVALLPITACTAQDAPDAAAPAAATSAAGTTATAGDAAAAATPAPARSIDPAAAEAALAAAASGAAPVEGTDYVLIPNGEPFEPANGQVEVVEVFGYTCPHCATFQPLMASWKGKMPADVRVTYVPAPFGGYWIPYAKAYYAAEALGVLDQTHDAMFNALHVQRALPIQGVTPEEVGNWYATNSSADAAEFAATMESFGTDAKLKRASQFIQRSGVDGTPTMVVAGKYKVTGKSLQDNLRIASHLVAMERAAREEGAARQ